MATVTIKKGTSRGKSVAGQTFTIIKGFQVGASSGEGFITVDGRKLYGLEKARIRVRSEKDFVINGAFENPVPAAAITKTKLKAAANNPFTAASLLMTDEPEEESTETDDEINVRTRRRFEILKKMAVGARVGSIRALVVTGAPGVGKTYGVEEALGECGMIEQMTGDVKKYEIVSGAMTPIGLYMKLYEHSEDEHVIVLDDCDMVFQDEISLNLLKAALDTSKKRMIHWNVDSKSLRKENIPNSFEFKGAIIFISNLNFKRLRGERIKAHMLALMSRSHYLDLTVHTMREKMLRIEDLVLNNNMLEQFNLDKRTAKHVMEFIREHKVEFNELSLRTVIKLAGLAQTFPEKDEWKEVATMSLTGNACA